MARHPEDGPEEEAPGRRGEAILPPFGREEAGELSEDVDTEVEDGLRRFCAARAIAKSDALVETALVGTADVVADRIARYAAAGATDLMLGFADFPSTRMVEMFAERVLGGR